MASISSLGIGSDLLNNQLLSDIIDAERAAGDLRLNSQQDLLDAKISAYGDVQSKLYDFSSAIVNLSDTSEVGTTLATSSDESILTASATASAPVGSYAVEVQATAKSHSLVSQSYSSTTASIFGNGSLTFKLGTTTYTGAQNDVYDTFTANPDLASQSITISAANGTDSLQGLRDHINNLDFGVTASIVNDGTGYVLQFVSSDTGVATSMEITASGDASLNALAYNATANLAGTNMTETQQGQDAILNVNGFSVTRSSNEVTELIDGVTLNLKSADVGKTVTIDVAPDIAGLGEKISAMVDSYNAYRELYEELTSYNSTDNTGSLLLGDSTLRTINTQMRTIMTSTVSGVTGTNFRSLSEMGIYTDQNDTFKLQFNQSSFSKALNEDREAVVKIFAQGGSATDINIEYLNSSINTQAGTYDIEVTQLATQGGYTGGSIDALDFAVPVTIDDANDEFTLSLNGVSDSITLTQDSYSTGNELATEIQQQINSAAKFKERGYSATVSYNASEERFEISSSLYGEDSTVSFSSVDTNTANSLGFTTSNQGAYQSASLATLNSSYFAGYGTSTIPGNTKVSTSTGLDFSLNNATFDLKLNGGAATTVTVNQKASGVDLNSDGIYGDRNDTLQAIQNAIDGTGLAGQVVASFDENDYLIFTTQTASGTDSIEISAVGSSATDLSLGLDATQGAQINGKDPGLTFGTGPTFDVVLNGTTSANTVTLPAGTYNTGAALATALETAINTDLAGDVNLSSQISGAQTGEGSRDISTNIDFSTSNAGFTLKVNGVEQTILMDADSGNNITDVQAKLDTAFGAGVVTAQLGSGNGLELVTVAQNHSQSIQVTSDGRGTQTDTTGTTAIAGGIDFSGANNATFDLLVNGGTRLSLDVNTDTSSGDKNSVLAAVQSALDTALDSAAGLAAGDVVAKLNGSDQIYFETVSANGVKTAAMNGSTATVRIENVDANAETAFGFLAVDNTDYTNGYDSFGLNDDINYGSDITASVEYQYDSVSDTGSLNIEIGGNGNSISFANLDSSAIAFLGLNTGSGTSGQSTTGTNVEGTINGVDAKGNGQYLSAQNGNVAATNGFYVANQTDFVLSGGVATDISAANNNNEFTIKVDGVETTITLADKTYNDMDLLAEDIQTAINNDATLKADKITVQVEFTSDINSAAYGTIGIISASTGSTSKVEITDISTEASSALGFVKGVGDGASGKNKEGDIDDASGIRVKITGGDLGTRGSVTYISGIADQLKDLLQEYLDPNGGLLATKFDTLDKQNELLAEEKESFNTRMDSREAQLAAQFAFNDAIIASLNTTASYLTSQFEAMTNSQKK